MRELFWGNVAEIITVKENIPDKNLYILKKLHPNAEIIKEKIEILTTITITMDKPRCSDKDLYKNEKIVINSVSYEISA